MSFIGSKEYQILWERFVSTIVENSPSEEFSEVDAYVYYSSQS